MFKAVATSSIFCLAAALILQLFLGYQQARRDMLQQVESVADAQVDILAKRLWELDYDALTAQAQSMLNARGVAGVVVQEVSGAFELRLGDFSWDKDEVAQITCERKLHSPNGPLDIVIGELQVIGGPESLQKNLWRGMAVSGGILALFAFAVSFCIILSFRKNITTPLAGLLTAPEAPSKPGEVFTALENCLLRMRRQAREDAGRLAGLECVLPGGTVAAHRIDSDWKLDFLGKDAAKLLGVDAAQLPENLLDIFHTDFRDSISRLLQSAVDNPEARRFCLMQPTGEHTGWRFHALVSRVEGGLAAYGVVLDEKGRLSAEARAAAIQADLKAVMAARAGLAKIDGHGRILEANSEFCEMFGYAPPDLDGLDLKDLSLSQASYSTFVRDYLEEAGERGLDVEYRLKRRNGQPVWIRMLARPFGENGGPWLVFQDISNQKQLQQELEIQSTNLRESVERTQRADKAKNEFLETMSHELRTPLNAVLGLAELLLRTNPTPEQRTRLRNLHESGQTLLRVVNDILDYSQLDDANVALQDAVFSLTQLLDCLRLAHQGRAAAKGLAFSVSAGPEIPDLLVGDKRRLFQVLSNVSSHAVKCAQDGGVRLGVKLLDRSADGVLLRFCVREEGTAASVQSVEPLFEPIADEKATPPGGTEGFGLGLSICRRIADLMGGEIRVESSPDKGTIFYFSLWLREGDVSADPATGSSRRCAGSKGRVLVVEDNRINRCMIREMLELANLEAHEAENGESALEMLEQTSYDAVLMDVQLPFMDGLEVVRRIRSNPAARELPVIAMTGHALNGDRERCIEAGMSDYLSKPIGVDHLLKALSRWLEMQGAPEDGAYSFPGRKPEGVEEFSPDSGLRPNIQQELAGEFLKKYSDAPRTIRDALNVGDIPKALRCAQALEGLSGNLGAKRLQRAAAQVLKDFHLGLSVLENRLNALQQALDELADEWGYDRV